MGTTHGLTDIILPSFDSSMEEGTVITWHVSVGETVAAGQVIAEIETAKATVELEAPADGMIETIEVPEGDEPVSVGTTLARLATGDRAIDSSAPRDGSATPSGEPPAGELETSARVPASPRARRLARERGIDLDRIEGSGPHGRIVISDLEVAASGEDDGTATTSRTQPDERAEPSTSPRLSSLGFEAGSYHLEPLTAMRKAIAHRMAESFREAPHFSLSVDVELDDVMQYRHVVNSSLADSDAKLSINDCIVWAAAAALKEVPEANVSYTDEGIARHHHANIAIAVAVDGGLVAPVLRAAETMSLLEVASGIRELVDKVRARSLGQTDITGGTFTVSNLGMYGIGSFSSVLTPPQACVLSVGAAEKRPIPRDSGYAIATRATVTLTCDHRVVDGVIGATFLSAFRHHLKTVVMDPAL